MEVSRKALLEALEAVRPGLSAEATIEQSDCFVFQNGRVFTYDDEVACSTACSLDITGAVKARPLLDLLGRLPEEMLDLSVQETELCVRGQRRKAGVRMEHDILLALGSIDWPAEEDWQDLPKDFVEAGEVVRQCVSRDGGAFALTCVHITPEFIESCDTQQATRYPMATGFQQATTLLRSRAILHIGTINPTKFVESESWIHFQNANGLCLSCRKYSEEYPDLADILAIDGTPVSLPDGLSTAADTANIFSKDTPDKDANQVEVTLSNHRLVIRSRGTDGWYQEVQGVDYEGTTMAFQISPALLKSVLARSQECVLSSNRLWIDAGKFTYVTALTVKSEQETE